MPAKFVGYTRISTRHQVGNHSLEAQEGQIRTYVADKGGELLAIYTEQESGAKKHRKALNEALARCKSEGATLVIYALSRLSRKVSYIANLVDSGVSFTALDCRDANKYMLYLMSLMAEWERDSASDRIKAGLRVAREKGVRLGRAVENRNQAIAFASSIKPTLDTIRAEGFCSVKAITAELNRRNVSSAYGTRWHVSTVWRLMQRLAA